ncbi:hypothetical protein ACE7GA_06315 [Roseomonas sp. CCTCC AB2023176]|uniref:hypothetical protein n=1 Tax=Roseomonas sp. CCTCC AB2023176 TaxID=3342640 RepID=UPI0035DB4488
MTVQDGLILAGVAVVVIVLPLTLVFLAIRGVVRAIRGNGSPDGTASSALPAISPPIPQTIARQPVAIGRTPEMAARASVPSPTPSVKRNKPTPVYRLVGSGWTGSLKIDSDARTLTFRTTPFASAVTIGFDQITGAEILQDGETVSRASVTGTLGRAAVGAVVAGPVGALVGAATASRTAKEKTRKVMFVVHTAAVSTPRLTIALYSRNDGLLFSDSKRAQDRKLRRALEAARDWHVRVSAAMRPPVVDVAATTTVVTEDATPVAPAPAPGSGRTVPATDTVLASLEELVRTGLMTREDAQAKAAVLVAQRFAAPAR